jgi:hypothetical protein
MRLNFSSTSNKAADNDIAEDEDDDARRFLQKRIVRGNLNGNAFAVCMHTETIIKMKDMERIISRKQPYCGPAFASNLRHGGDENV